MSPAQEPRGRTCAHMVVHELLAETEPEYRERRLRAEEQTRQSIESGEAMRVTARLLTIPVVVHVVHRTQEENISAAQIRSQITVLNRDFRAKNPDRRKVPDVWKGLVIDSNIQFELAKKDPQGNQTNGITRTATTVAAFGADNSVKRKTTGGVAPWPTDRYLNVWVCNLAGGLLGYAQFPGGPRRTDGVVVLHSAFGTRGRRRRRSTGDAPRRTRSGTTSASAIRRSSRLLSQGRPGRYYWPWSLGWRPPRPPRRFR